MGDIIKYKYYIILGILKEKVIEKYVKQPFNIVAVLTFYFYFFLYNNVHYAFEVKGYKWAQDSIIDP